MLKFASSSVLCSGLAACGGGSGTFAPEPQNPTVPRVMIRPAYPDASFVAPLAVSTAPGDDTHLYVAQQDGRVLSLDGRLSARPRFILRHPAGGVLVAFHPRVGSSSVELCGREVRRGDDPDGEIGLVIAHLD